MSFNVAEAVKALQELGVYNARFEIACTPINPIDIAQSSRGIRFTKSRGKLVSTDMTRITYDSIIMTLIMTLIVTRNVVIRSVC